MTLTFHKVEPHFTWGVTNYPPKRFRRLLEVIRRFNTSVTREAVSLTFDDGYQSFLSYADPLLREQGFTATIFAVSGYAGKQNSWDYSSFLAPSPHLTGNELQTVVAHGHRVQSHGKSHCDLRALSAKQLYEELTDSKSWIEDLTGVEVTEICYPFGLSDSRVEEVAQDVGYTRGWSLNPSDSGPFTYGRWGVYSFDTPLTVGAKLNPGSVGAHVEILKLRMTNFLARAGRFAFWTD